MSLRNTTTERRGRGKRFVCRKRDRVITCVFYRDLNLTLMFSGLKFYRKICLKEGELV